MRSWFRVVCIVGFLACSTVSAAASCTEPGTTIFFVNGINTTPAGAAASRDALRQRLESSGETECVKLAVAYNFTLVPLTFEPTVVDEHLRAYRAELALGNRVILVAHSNGNVYANEAHKKLTPTERSSVGVVAVATVLGSVPGEGPWVTLSEDTFIAGIAGHLQANTTNTGGTCPDIVGCHDFVRFYLNGEQSGPKILQAVIGMIPRLVRPPIPQQLIFNTSDSEFTPGFKNQGWWSPAPNQNFAENDNYGVGRGASFIHRNFFTFDLSFLSGTVVAATLEVRRGVYASPNSEETLGLFDVSTPAAILNNNTGTNDAIFDDLGTGQSYGIYIVSSSGNPDDLLRFPLNAAAVADINNARGGFFSIGGALLSLSQPQTPQEAFIDEFLFGFTNTFQTGRETIQRLVIEVANGTLQGSIMLPSNVDTSLEGVPIVAFDSVMLVTQTQADSADSCHLC